MDNPTIQVAGQVLEAVVCRIRGCRVYPPSALAMHEEAHRRNWEQMNGSSWRETAHRPRRKRGPKLGSLHPRTIAVCKKITEFVARHPNGVKSKEIAPIVMSEYRDIVVAQSRVCCFLREGRVPGVRVETAGRGIKIYPEAK